MGKTGFVCRFLNRFTNWAAVKIITYHTHKIPQDISNKGYDIITNPTILQQKGTDTGRMWEIVGNKVFWVRTKPESQKQAFDELFKILGGFDSVIFEATSILKYHKPDKAIMLIDNGEKKPSARNVLDKIDIFLPAINSVRSMDKIVLPEEHRNKYLYINWLDEKVFDEFSLTLI